MKSLKDVVRQAHGLAETKALPDSDEHKVLEEYVLPRHYAWMKRPEKDRQWSTTALKYAADVMAGTFKHDRHDRFSPSGIGSACQRETLFSFAGRDKEAFPLLNQEKMDSGTFEHLRWQMEGLSAGYMTQGEVWVHFPGMRMGGSVDGLLDDGSLFELKNTGDHLFKAAQELMKPPSQRKAADQLRGIPLEYFTGMHKKHLLQIEAYLELDRLAAQDQGRPRVFTDYASLVYQSTGNRECLEFRVKSNPARLAGLHRSHEVLLELVDANRLPPMLSGCHKHHWGPVDGVSATEKESTVYRRCPYRDICPTATGVWEKQ